MRGAAPFIFKFHWTAGPSSWSSPNGIKRLKPPLSRAAMRATRFRRRPALIRCRTLICPRRTCWLWLRPSASFPNRARLPSASFHPHHLGQDVQHDWNAEADPADELSRVILVWASQEKNHSQLRLFKTPWVNPMPETEILSIDYISTMSDAAPFLIAITTDL